MCMGLLGMNLCIVTNAHISINTYVCILLKITHNTYTYVRRYKHQIMISICKCLNLPISLIHCGLQMNLEIVCTLHEQTNKQKKIHKMDGWRKKESTYILLLPFYTIVQLQRPPYRPIAHLTDRQKRTISRYE